MCKLAGLEFEEEVVSMTDPSARAELLLLSPSFLVPSLTHDGRKGLGHLGDRRIPGRDLPQGRPAAGGPRRARALPGDLRGDALGLLQSALGAADEPQGASSGLQGVGGRASRHRARRWPSGASASTRTAGPSCSAASPWRTPCTRRCARRFLTYDVKLDAKCAAYTRSIMEWPAMAQWIADARAELEELEELDVEF